MASRPDTGTGGRPGSAPFSVGSAGVETVALSQANFNPSTVAEEMAEDMTVAMFDGFLSKSLTELPDEADHMRAEQGAADLREEMATLNAQCEQLQAELASARSEIEFAGLKEEELENRHQLAQKTIESLKSANDKVLGQMQQQSAELNEVKAQLAQRCDEDSNDKSASDNALTSLRNELRRAQDESVQLRKELEEEKHQRQQREDDAMASILASTEATERECSLESEIAGLRVQVSTLEQELSEMQREAEERRPFGPASVQPTVELAQDSSDETPLLTAAYQQISVLNTQLAHLYTELTLARTEAQQLRGEGSTAQGASTQLDGGGLSTADAHKQNQQIADLVSDIRHLQLDLEYHQQKLDQMIEEKQQMMKDLKKAQQDVVEARQQIEEKDQMLRHREVDISHLKQELRSPWNASGVAGGASAQSDELALTALRAEAAAKDSALIVSHYELHKEKLMRDRLEQKNLKLMERMQKLMMVVETMRKESVSLERTLATKERACEEQDRQLRSVTQKAKQLQKLAKASKGGGSGSQRNLSNKGNISLELESPSQQAGGSLPPLRSVDSAAGGRRSGASTPRSARGAPTSPYGTR